MIVIREIQPNEYAKARELDVTESGTSIYRMVDGQWVEELRTWSRSPWGDDRFQDLILCWEQATADGGMVLGAFDGHLLVGEVVFRPRLTPETAQLESLHISRPYRRQGLASALVSEVIRLARESGHRELYVSATETQSAVNFYRRKGFAPTVRPHPRLLELEPMDIHMTMALQGKAPDVR